MNKGTVIFDNKPSILSFSAVVGKKEGDGPLGKYFDAIEGDKCEHPTRDILKTLIRTKSFTEIGKIYGVSDNTIRKWCVKHSLPSKKSEIKKIDDSDWEKI